MDAFYALATADYAVLAAARDWAADLRRASSNGVVRLLDVACGSGKFPTALVQAGLAEAAGDLTVDVDLLDPSAFSIAEARGALRPPFRAAAELEIAIEELDRPARPYDVAWATHALYAVPPALLDDGLAAMCAGLRPGGFGAIAHVTSSSHYLRVHEAYRSAHDPQVTGSVSAERITEGLKRAGVEPDVESIPYSTSTSDPEIAEGFLQRCLFDDELSLDAMTAPGPRGDELATYLASCRQGEGWTFDHEVCVITWDAAR